MIVMDLTRIKDEIPKEVEVWCQEHASKTSFTYCAWLEYHRGEIVERIFGSRHYKAGVKIREIMRDCTGKSGLIVRDLLYRHMCGYIPVFEAKDIYDRACGWGIKIFSSDDFGKWIKPDDHIGVSFTYINSDMLFSIPEFKYCGYSGGGVTSYLDAYRKDHSVEMFGKMGLSLSPVLMRKAKTDGKFRRFLYENRVAIQKHGVTAAMYAYKHNVDVESARMTCYLKRQLDMLAASRFPEIRGTDLDRQKVLDYVDFNDINYASYDDYLKCCKALRLDLSDTKVVYPNDFERMHDLRAAEYSSLEAKRDKKRRAKLYRDFKKKVAEYKPLEQYGEKYAIICPTGVEDLIREGNALSHCVGKMGYDKKVVDGVSIIMFVREADKLNTPFVTVEYRIDRKVLAQCYGYKDSRPNEDVLAYCNAWAKTVQTGE